MWEKEGVDVEKIEAECKDTEDFPKLGKTYNVNSKTVSKADITKSGLTSTTSARVARHTTTRG